MVLKRYPLAVSLVVVAVGLLALHFIPQDGVVGMTLVRGGIAVVCLVVAVLCMGAQTFKLSAKGFGFTFRCALPFLVIALVLALLSLLATVVVGGTLYSVPILLLQETILCFFVGVMEEIMFRVFFQGGLLAHMGSSKAGVFGALTICGLVFGFAHVLPNVLGGSLTTVMWIQVVFKTLTTAIFSFALSVAYLATRNFWAIAIMHMLNDLIAFAMEALIDGTLVTTSYVTTDSPSRAILSYVVMLILYIPALVASIRKLNRLEVPQSGPFVDEYEPRRAALLPKGGGAR